MADGLDDLDRSAKQDLQKGKRMVRNYQRGQGIMPSKATVLEYTLWLGALLTAGAMLAVMPWVGADGILTGTQWLGFFMALIALLAGAAMAVRAIPG